MLTTAPVTAEGSWVLTQALLRFDSARDRIEHAIVDLRGMRDDCPWKARAIELVLQDCEQQQRQLLEILDQLGSVESALRAG